jgi:uncharacterized protein (DUF1697 family)
MPVMVALMRSIVINGKRVKMSDARAMAERIGCTDVHSVIATGNLLFRSRRPPRALEQDLEAACEAFYGRSTEIVVKTAAQWQVLLAANPFRREAEAAPSRLLVWAMRSPLPDSGLEQLRRRARGEERVERTPEGDFYVWFGEGPISASKITGGFGLKALGAVGTNRNWNTTVKIARGLDSLAG